MMKRFLTALLVLTLMIYGLVAQAEITIHYLDVGQADAAIIQCDGETLMIDGGNAADSSFVYSYLKKTLGIKQIDYMVATHPHEDHIGGLSGALNACSVGILYSPVSVYDSDEWFSLLKYSKVEPTVPQVGDKFFVGGAMVEFISPSHTYADINDMSLVTRITYGDVSFLFTGDAEAESEYDMIASGLEIGATVLKVGHHGSDSSSTSAFIDSVHPQYAVISVGSGNSYGHPTDLTLSTLERAGITVFRTDELGTIICVSDGHEITFSNEHGANLTSIAAGDAHSTTDYEGEDPEGEAALFTYVLNKNTKKFHVPTCSSAGEIKPKNRGEYTGDRNDLLEKGYIPCKRCNP